MDRARKEEEEIRMYDSPDLCDGERERGKEKKKELSTRHHFIFVRLPIQPRMF